MVDYVNYVKQLTTMDMTVDETNQKKSGNGFTVQKF